MGIVSRWYERRISKKLLLYYKKMKAEAPEMNESELQAAMVRMYFVSLGWEPPRIDYHMKVMFGPDTAGKYDLKAALCLAFSHENRGTQGFESYEDFREHHAAVDWAYGKVFGGNESSKA
jgi:hypothetical protein